MRGYQSREYLRVDGDGLPSIVQEIHHHPGSLSTRFVFFDGTVYTLVETFTDGHGREGNWSYIYAEREGIEVYKYLVSIGETVGARGKQLHLL